LHVTWSKTLLTQIQPMEPSLINQLFLPFEAQQICQLPLVDTNSQDDLTWFGTKDGTYTVKSGYQVIMDWKNLNIN
jgi:hypothetical protein